LSLVLVVLGLLFKLSLVPLHFWVPDVYEGAPTPVTAFMSVAVKIGVLGAIIRMFSSMGGGFGMEWSVLFWWGAVVTILGGNLLALVQENLKRMLAYSSIAHAGYLILGLVTLGTDGYTAILFYLLIYLIMNVLAFGSVSMLAKDDDSYYYSDLRGLSENSPLLAATLAVAMISLTGLPPTAGFMGKLFLFYAVVQAGYPLLAVIAVIGSVISVGYYFQVIVYSYMQEPDEESGFIGLNLGGLSRLTAVLSALAILYLGLNPGALYERIYRILDGLSASVS